MGQAVGSRQRAWLGEEAGNEQTVAGPLTSLALDLQTNVNSFIYEVHDSPEVILTELS